MTFQDSATAGCLCLLVCFGIVFGIVVDIVFGMAWHSLPAAAVLVVACCSEFLVATTGPRTGHICTLCTSGVLRFREWNTEMLYGADRIELS